MIKYTLRRTDKRLIEVEEYDDKYILHDEQEGADHGGTSISKITFEENERLCDLCNYLKCILKFSDESLEILYND